MIDSSEIRWSGPVGSICIPDDGTFPGNSRVPLVLYKEAVPAARSGNAGAVEEIFASNGWGSMWRNGIFSYHHYHSTAHEALGIYDGEATVQLGGPDGITLEIAAGDVVLIPAGVAHKLLSSRDLAVVGAYPPGPSVDLLRGRPGDRPAADESIRALPSPPTDPVHGEGGPVHQIIDSL